MCEREELKMDGGRQIALDAYLERIRYAGPCVADAATLAALQRAHLMTVPFENLDIHWERPIIVDIDRFYSKVVVERRGGFCYELNGLFNELLKRLGYETRLVSARVFNSGVHGPEFDHAAIIARAADDEYLVDVGFGAFSAEPLRYVFDVEQYDANGWFMIRGRDDGYIEVMKRDDGIWRSEYIFKDVPRQLSEFGEMCDFQQYSPESHFRKGKLCSIMTAYGRKTLTDRSYIVTANGRKTEREVASDAEFYELLEREFAIRRVLSESAVEV